MDDVDPRLSQRSAPAGGAYLWFKAVVFALLAWNASIYIATGTLSEGLDSAAWLVLLALFELETGYGDHFREGHTNTAIRGGRMVATAAILAAAIGYVRENDWLGAANIGLWISVVALLEIEVREFGAVARHQPRFMAAAAGLYSGLGALVLVWLWQSEWFDAYDAALWLVAFAAIEMNILGIPHQRPAAERGVAGPA
jgi:hypothetical protein